MLLLRLKEGRRQYRQILQQMCQFSQRTYWKMRCRKSKIKMDRVRFRISQGAALLLQEVIRKFQPNFLVIQIQWLRLGIKRSSLNFFIHQSSIRHLHKWTYLDSNNDLLQSKNVEVRLQWVLILEGALGLIIALRLPWIINRKFRCVEMMKIIILSPHQ